MQKKVKIKQNRIDEVRENKRKRAEAKRMKNLKTFR